MPINSTHPEFTRMIPIIKKTQDAFEGCVKEYVPKLSGQSSQEYEAYVGRSSYYNVTERTLAALIGALTRKPHTIEYVYGDDPVFSEGESTDEFIQECYQALFLTGKVGLLCDYSEELQTPYIINYDGSSIINWSGDFIVLQEWYYAQDPNDKYQTIQECQYRELFLDENGFYAVNIWRKQGTSDKYAIYQTIEPTYIGRRLEAIPFVCVTPYEVAMETYKPVLSTLAEINIEHFKIATDVAHGAHFLAIPTPWISGQLTSDQQTVRLGTNDFIQMNQGGQVGFLEFEGKGLGFLKDLLSQKEEYMYNLGSRMLQFKKGVESSDALQIRLGAEGAILTTIANSLEEGLTEIFDVYNAWWGITEVEVEVYLNKDFSPTGMTPQEMSALLELFQKGVISLDTLLQRLYEGEIIDDVQEELEMLTGAEEPGEELEMQIEGPTSEEADSEEELAKYSRDAIIRANSQ